MSLRVAFDVDGVLADFAGAFRRAAAEVLDRSPALPVDPERHASGEALSRADVRRVWDLVRGTPNWWTGVAPYEPAQIARLASLARQHRWEVVFLTTRPATLGEAVQFQTQWWLEQHGFALPAVVTVPGSRGAVANALELEACVDDRLLNCLDVVSVSRSKALLVQRQPDTVAEHQAAARGVAMVRTLEEALDALIDLQDGLRTGRGPLTRLRDWFKPARPVDRLPIGEREIPPLRPGQTSDN